VAFHVCCHVSRGFVFGSAEMRGAPVDYRIEVIHANR
jgi:hypothetical protein